MIRFLSLGALALAVAACSGSEFDRDAGACVILSKQGGECTVTIPAPKAPLAEPRP